MSVKCAPVSAGFPKPVWTLHTQTLFGVLAVGEFSVIFLFETLSLCMNATTHKENFQPLQGADGEEGRLAADLLARPSSGWRHRQWFICPPDTVGRHRQAFNACKPSCRAVACCASSGTWLQEHCIKEEMPIPIKVVTCDCRGQCAPT